MNLLLKACYGFDRLLRENAKRSSYSMVAIGVIGLIAHSFYGFFWTQISPLENENVWLRAAGAASCIGLLINKFWPRSLQKCLPWYWFAVVLYSLPFFATLQLFSSNYSVLRSMLEVTMVFFVVVVFSQPILVIANVGLGVLLAACVAWFTVPNFSEHDHAIFFSVHLHLLVYTLIGGLIFSRSNLKGLLAREKIQTMRALTGSIAHELKNPLSQIRYRLGSIGQHLPRPAYDEADRLIRADDLEAVFREMAKSKFAIARGMQLIDMILDEVSERPPDPSQLRYLSAAAVVRKAIEEFTYQNQGERERVALHEPCDFAFRGDEARYVFVIFNLLKNALFYFGQYPQARVYITVDSYSVTVEDTGPGMSPEVLARAFEAFHSIGKPGGTGLGLSFCKRTMLAFGGDITCESIEGKFTRFVMRFPVVPAAELAAHREVVMKRAQSLFSGKRILVAEDSSRVRESVLNMLKPLRAEIDEAEDGQIALQMLHSQRYDAMLLDLSMPLVDGYETATRVRRGDASGHEQMAIVVHSSEAPYFARLRLESIGVDAFLPKGCSALELIEALCDAQVAAEQRTKTWAASTWLSGKKVMLVDDDAFNRKHLCAMLRSRGVDVIEASDGHIAFERLRQLGTVDVVITDMQMQGLDGLGLTRAIRSLSLPAGLTPVIAMSAHSDPESRARSLLCGVNEFLLKPIEPLTLFERLNHVLSLDSRVSEDVSAEDASATTNAVEILNTSQLNAMRDIGISALDIAQAFEVMRSQLEELVVHVDGNNIQEAKRLMHSLIGAAGQLGAQAFHQEVQANFTYMGQVGKCPSDSEWLVKLRGLLIRTEHLVRDCLAQELGEQSPDASSPCG